MVSLWCRGPSFSMPHWTSTFGLCPACRALGKGTCRVMALGINSCRVAPPGCKVPLAGGPVVGVCGGTRQLQQSMQGSGASNTELRLSTFRQKAAGVCITLKHWRQARSCWELESPERTFTEAIQNKTSVCITVLNHSGSQATYAGH